MYTPLPKAKKKKNNETHESLKLCANRSENEREKAAKKKYPGGRQSLYLYTNKPERNENYSRAQ